MTPNLFELFQRLHLVERELWNHHKIGEEGAYAARMVASALGAEVIRNGVNRGSDLFHPELKRIEVRSRRRPLDDRNETRIALGDKKRGYFDYCAHVLFNSDYTIARAYIVPHDAIFRHLEVSRRRYVRFEGGAALPESRDITSEMIAAQQRM